jgi:hypothetical protein
MNDHPIRWYSLPHLAEMLSSRPPGTELYVEVDAPDDLDFTGRIVHVGSDGVTVRTDGGMILDNVRSERIRRAEVRKIE